MGNMDGRALYWQYPCDWYHEGRFSKNNYMFNVTRKEQNRDSNNFMFNNEPMFIQSNINGGYGIFGGKSIAKKAYIPTFFPTNGWLDY